MSIRDRCEDEDEKLLIPKNIARNPSLFLHGAIDNNDFNEETLSGKESTHVTAMVVYHEQNPSQDGTFLLKLKPTREQSDNDLRALNCQEIYH